MNHTFSFRPTSEIVADLRDLIPDAEVAGDFTDLVGEADQLGALFAEAADRLEALAATIQLAGLIGQVEQ